MDESRARSLRAGDNVRMNGKVFRVAEVCDPDANTGGQWGFFRVGPDPDNQGQTSGRIHWTEFD